MRKMPQTRCAQTVCHFSHNADFDQLRISKYPANAHEINYFSMLVLFNTYCTGFHTLTLYCDKVKMDTDDVAAVKINSYNIILNFGGGAGIV